MLFIVFKKGSKSLNQKIKDGHIGIKICPSTSKVKAEKNQTKILKQNLNQHVKR